MDTNLPLVSIITPCYNGEAYVQRFLDSVLEQTYSNIELIFVNDGSTDNTESIVLSYKKRFENRGIEFVYIYQENKDIAGAVNQGLKVFRGDYLTWPDSDDILHKENISKKVEFLERNKEYGFVLCKTLCLDEHDLSKSIGILERNPVVPDNLFLDLITENNVYFAPGGYMVRTSAFLDVKPNRHIYERRKGGQDWQILLPLAYKYLCGYLQEVLFYYVVRGSSHSRLDKDLEGLLYKTFVHEDTIKTVIEEMNIPENDYYQNIITIKYIRKRLFLAYSFRKQDMLKEQYKLLQQNNAVDRQSAIYYYCGRNRLLDCGNKLIILLLRIFRKLKRMLVK